MRFCLLLSTAVVALSSSPAVASTIVEVLGTHTTHQPLVLKSTPSFSFKVARICSLGDNNCNTDNIFNQDVNSKKCPSGYVFIDKKGCILDKCPPDFNFNTCSGTTSIQSATTTTPSGKICYKCRAEECSDYPITASCPVNGTCSNCPDNSTKKKLVSCATNYKISANTCILKICPTDFACLNTETCISGTCKNDTCPVGYQKSNICSNGISGTKNTAAGTPCYQCKDCPNLGTLSSCPTNAVCTLEACSGKFYTTGCAVNAKDSDTYWCNIATVKCYIPINQKCVIPPTCETLGYKQNSTQCSGKPTLKCPFDNTKLFCLN